MASISIVVTDNKNGIISSSYNFTDQEIKRITDALKAVYTGKVKDDDMDPNIMDDVAYNRELFRILSKNLVQSILNTVYETEVQKIVTDARQAVNKLEVREI